MISGVIMQINFQEKKVFITGGSRGIGKEIAKSYTALGAKVVVTGTSKTRPDDLDPNISYEELYVANDTPWREAVNTIVEKYDGFDICINNAGRNKVNPIYETQHKDIDAILLLNLNAPLYIASVISKKMVEKKYGFIINIASIFGVVSKEGRDVYTASKSGLIGATKTMAIDLARDNILVNAISPGFVDTELTRDVLGVDGMQAMQKRIPMQKLAQTSDIVPTILFLTSEYNTYITGQNIIIDGGFTLE